MYGGTEPPSGRNVQLCLPREFFSVFDWPDTLVVYPIQQIFLGAWELRSRVCYLGSSSWMLSDWGGVLLSKQVSCCQHLIYIGEAVIRWSLFVAYILKLQSRLHLLIAIENAWQISDSTFTNDKR